MSQHTQYDYDKLFLAYEECRADNTVHFRKIIDLQSKLDKAIEALEFYASASNWGHISPKIAEYSVIQEDIGNGSFMLCESTNTDDDRVGGKKARETLKEIKK